MSVKSLSSFAIALAVAFCISSCSSTAVSPQSQSSQSQGNQTAVTIGHCTPSAPHRDSNGVAKEWQCTPHEPTCIRRTHFSRNGTDVFRSTQLIASFGLVPRYTADPLPPSPMGSDRAQSIMEEVRQLRGTLLGPDEVWHHDQEIDCDAGNFRAI